MSDVRQAVAWIAPEISGPVANPKRSKHSLADLDSIGQQAWEDGFQKGYQAGQAAAVSEQQPHRHALEQQVAHFEAILDLLSKPLAELDALVEIELAGLACNIARHVVRRELRADPSQVIAAVREAVALLPVAARDVRVQLHPEDAAILRQKLAAPQAERAWTIVENPVLERGGCRVVADNSQIDARVESRIGAVIATVLGDQRVASMATDAGNVA